MPSKISYSKNGSLIQPMIFKKNLTRFWPFMLIYMIYLVILYPMVLHLNFSDYHDTSAAKLVAGHFASLRDPISIFLIALVMAMAMFSYLYQSRSANMMHAFPVTRTQLFVTNYLSGLVMLLVPQIICTLLTNLVILGKADEMIWVAWAWLGITAGETLFFYSFACLMVMFTGQLFTSALFYFIWNFVYVAAVFLINATGAVFMYGVSFGAIEFQYTPLFPLGYMMSHVGFVYNGQLLEFGLDKGMGVWTVYLVVAVLFTVLAWYIYQNRRIECAGDFLSMKWTAPVFRWGVVLIGGTASALFFSYMLLGEGGSWNGRIARFVIFLVLIGAALFFVSEMFIEKSVRVFRKRIITECVCCIAVLLVGAALLQFDVFGIESYVPQAGAVENVTLGWQNREVSYETPEQIGQFCELHELLTEHVSDQKRHTDGNAGYTSVVENGDVWYGYITLTYTLSDGSRVSRQYNVATTDAAFSDELQKQLTELTSDHTGYLADYLGYNYEEIGWKLQGIGIEGVTTESDSEAAEIATEYTTSYTYDEIGYVDEKEQLELLAEAIYADIDAGALVPQQDNGSYSHIDLDVSMSFTAKADIADIRYGEASSAGYSLQQGTAGVLDCYMNLNLTDRCTHTIDALIRLGLIDSAEELHIQN